MSMWKQKYKSATLHKEHSSYDKRWLYSKMQQAYNKNMGDTEYYVQDWKNF